MIKLTPDELADFELIQGDDELAGSDYTTGRGALTGHAFADNGFSMVRDLTTGTNIDADGIDEADTEVASKS